MPDDRADKFTVKDGRIKRKSQSYYDPNAPSRSVKDSEVIEPSLLDMTSR